MSEKLRSRNPGRTRGGLRQEVHLPRRQENATAAAPSPSSRWKGRNTFGGACNRYYNIRHNVRYEVEQLDLGEPAPEARLRDPRRTAGTGAPIAFPGRVGMNRSFLVNTFYPLYSHFFSQLGFDVVLPDLPTPGRY
jgi:hypothetical protein